MAEQMTGDNRGLRLAARHLVAEASRDPEPVVARWSRRWRYALVLGTPILFWTGLFAAIHWG